MHIKKFHGIKVNDVLQCGMTWHCNSNDTLKSGSKFRIQNSNFARLLTIYAFNPVDWNSEDLIDQLEQHANSYKWIETA